MKSVAISSLLLAGLASIGCASGSDSASFDPMATAEEAVGPVTDHPRLWIRSSDVPRLRSWATSANPMYAKALQYVVKQAVGIYDTQFFPGGQPNPVWPDPGNVTWSPYVTESYAELFAFMSLIEPDPTVRAQHGLRARNLFMYVMNEALKGATADGSSVPFRDPAFITYDRANWWGEAFGLTVDWAYPYFSAEDKAIIQKVFLRWSNELVQAGTSGMLPVDPTVSNSTSLISNSKRLRFVTNNYFTGHMRNLSLMALSMDAVDDPVVDATASAMRLGNTLRSYIPNITGTWLYQLYAAYESPSVSAPVLGVSPTTVGFASGGVSPEGSMYGVSLGYLSEAFLGLYTAGYGDVATAGPQAGIIQSSYWERWLSGFFHTVAPAARPPTNSTYSYLGPLFQMASYGDVIRTWAIPEFIQPIGSLGVLSQVTGRTDRLPALRWAAEAVLEGSSANLYTRATNVLGNSKSTSAILHYMLFDPSAPPAADPRPALPTMFVDKSVGRVLARTDWSPEASWFTYLCSWLTTPHQNGWCNQVEFYRKGEWLTKSRSGYSTDLVSTTSDYNNTLAIENDKPGNLNWFEKQTSIRGGQWTNGMSAGDPTVTSSSGTGWLFTQGDSTNLYNRPSPSSTVNAAMDVTHASRSTVWLSPDHIITYDRATTKTSGRFKRYNLSLIGATTIRDNLADSVTPNGQHFFVQNMLPAGATMTVSAAEDFDRVADLEPTRFRLVIENPTNPNDVRFLHVLQGADAGASADPAKLIESSAGTAFQGVVVRDAAVMFPVNLGTPFKGTAYTLPSAVSLHLVTGLVPLAGYTVSTQTVQGGVQVVIQAGGNTVADSAGVLVAPMSSSTCAYLLSTSAAQVAAAGGSGSVSVNANTDCAWSATSDSPWLMVTGGASGTGAGTVGYIVASNTSTSPRTGTLTIAGQTFTVTQDGVMPVCSYGLGSTSAQVATGGGTGSVSVAAPTGCAWTVASNASWISLLSGGSGSGSGTVGYAVASNTSTSPRTGTLTIAGQTFTVTQSAAATATCSYGLGSTNAQVAAAGGTGSVSVATPAGCAWTVASNVSWISLLSGGSGSGSGTVGYAVASNTSSSARTGTLTIAGQTFTVTQNTVNTASSDSVCVTIKRGALGDIADTQVTVEAGDMTKNYGSASYWATGLQSGPGSPRVGLIRFDLSPIPAGMHVVSANLTLTETPSTLATVNVHRCLADWNEMTVTWNSFANAYDPNVLLSFSNGGKTASQVSLDLTSIVDAWVQGKVPNQGLVLDQPVGAYTRFWSSEYNVSLRPRLLVCYAPN